MEYRHLFVPATAAFFVLLFALERAFPLRATKSPLGHRLFVNAVVAALALLTARFVVQPAAVAMLDVTERRAFGLLRLAALPPAVEFGLAVLLLDLSFYYWHRANHRWGFLWRFHNIHHIDPDLDVSTALRFHFIEVALSSGFRVIQVAVLGVPLTAYLVYEVLFIGNTLFHHSNLRLPIRLERLLNGVLVTPRMHGIHHSQVRDEDNANFSSVFPWWDRIHGTLTLNIPQAHVRIGIPGYATPGDNALASALVLPFKPQRNYWRDADATRNERNPAVCGPDRARLEP